MAAAGPWLAMTEASAATTISVPGDQATIQAAIAAAADGDTVVVGPGTYVENLDFLGKDVSVVSSRGPAATVIDGNQGGSVVTFGVGEGPSATLEGFTIQNGIATFESGYSGGGVHISGSSPTIRGNVIVRNASCEGAGIGVNFASPLITGNTISDNRPEGCSGGVGGGGISVTGEGSTRIVGNTISDNSSYYGGGIALFAAGTPVIRDNIIRNNEAGEGGGISIVNRSDASIVQNLIVGNSAGQGAGLYLLVPAGDRGPIVVNNTIADNTNGAGLFLSGFGDQVRVVNNIVVAPAAYPAILCDPSYSPAPPQLSFNNAYSGQATAYAGSCAGAAGTNGNISADPLFVDSTAGDYHLRQGSPSIDAGTTGAPDLPAKDLAGLPRVVNGQVDQGVYEAQGSGSPPTGPCSQVVSPDGRRFVKCRIIDMQGIRLVRVTDATTMVREQSIPLSCTPRSVVKALTIRIPDDGHAHRVNVTDCSGDRSAFMVAPNGVVGPVGV